MALRSDAAAGRNGRVRSRLLSLLAGAALLPAWLGLAGGWHWALDLFAHFRWQYLLVAIAVMLLARWQRNRWLLATGVATLLLNAVLIGQVALQSRPGPAALAPDFSLRVLAINVLGSNPDKQAVLDHIRATDADIVFLAEADEAWVQALAPLSAAYPHQLLHPRPDNFGLALLSRVPLEAAQVRQVSPGARPTAIATLTHQSRRLLFIGMHPPPPMGAALAAVRDAQIAALGELAAQVPFPVIAVGDFNATPWSAPMRRLAQRGLGLHGQPDAWQPTWMRGSPLGIPIDHVLTTAPLRVDIRQVGPHVGSDHRPVLATVRWMAAVAGK